MTAEAPPRISVTTARIVPALLGAAVLAEIGYPLAAGPSRAVLTGATVLLVAAAALTHAAQTRGAATALVLAAVTVLGGFAVEVLGVHTGAPFGRYRYGSALGPRLFGVPMVIAFAWPMLAWPAALAARRLTTPFAARVALGAWALAVWDLFLDPQMVAAGYWRWAAPGVHLPGVPTVPLSDYAGWLATAGLVSLAMQTVLDRAGEPAEAGVDRWPLAFYAWTWASSTLALAAFLHLGAAALWGGLAMGSVAVPVLRMLAGAR
jgi:uncharacterized membrane protein